MSGRRMFVTWLTSAALALSGFAAVPVALQDRDVATPHAQAAFEPERRALPTPSVETAVSRHPFRLGRTPPNSGASLGVDGGADPSSGGVTPRPGWRLTGIVEGPVTVAVLEGVAGAPGASRLVVAGDTIGPYQIALVARDHVVVGHGNQTWSLALEVPWS